MTTVKITLEYATLEEAITAMATLKGTKTPAAETAKEPATGKSAGATGKAKSTEPAATVASTAAEKKADVQLTQPAASPAPSGSVDYAPVAAAIAEAAKTHRAELVALLSKFGAKSGKELKPEQYADFGAQLAELVKPADDLS